MAPPADGETESQKRALAGDTLLRVFLWIRMLPVPWPPCPSAVRLYVRPHKRPRAPSHAMGEQVAHSANLTSTVYPCDLHVLPLPSRNRSASTVQQPQGTMALSSLLLEASKPHQAKHLNVIKPPRESTSKRGGRRLERPTCPPGRPSKEQKTAISLSGQGWRGLGVCLSLVGRQVPPLPEHSLISLPHIFIPWS